MVAFGDMSRFPMSLDLSQNRQAEEEHTPRQSEVYNCWAPIGFLAGGNLPTQTGRTVVVFLFGWLVGWLGRTLPTRPHRPWQSPGFWAAFSGIWPWVKIQIVPPVNIPIQPLK